jgi:hypothetical protein
MNLNPSTMIHIVSEIVVVGGLFYYVDKQNKALKKEIQELKTACANEFQAQQQTITHLQNVVQNLMKITTAQQQASKSQYSSIGFKSPSASQQLRNRKNTKISVTPVANDYAKELDEFMEKENQPNTTDEVDIQDELEAFMSTNESSESESDQASDDNDDDKEEHLNNEDEMLKSENCDEEVCKVTSEDVDEITLVDTSNNEKLSSNLTTNSKPITVFETMVLDSVMLPTGVFPTMIPNMISTLSPQKSDKQESKTKSSTSRRTNKKNK